MSSHKQLFAGKLTGKHFSSLRVYLILRARLHEGGGPQTGEVTRLGGVNK